MPVTQMEIIEKLTIRCEALEAKLVESERKLERERLRLAVCGTAALGYFQGCKDEYKSSSLDDVLRLVKHAKAIHHRAKSKEKGRGG